MWLFSAVCNHGFVIDRDHCHDISAHVSIGMPWKRNDSIRDRNAIFQSFGHSKMI